MTGPDAVSAVAIVGTGLMAGLFFGWAVSVIPGTRHVDDHTYVQTMQQINRAIVNPAFVIPFVGTPLLLAAAAVLRWRSGDSRAATWMATAAVLYVGGLIGITAGANIPLNNALESFDLAAADSDAIGEGRISYEGPWNRWHAVRTAAVVLAFGCATIAAIGESE